MRWFKSSHSNDDGGQCVEVAMPHGKVLVRDSKLGSPRIRIAPASWARFTAELRASGVERPNKEWAVD
ncbi:MULTISPECIES: DUF397 domain-containing protein [Streptomyces]|uniref:DUF397 domain-containing protein n=1 Tax=Streptomyces TaxID=1883 RepID=UPI0031CFE8A3